MPQQSGQLLVTGGSGYVGFRLGCHLASKGYTVLLFDLRPPVDDLPHNVSFLQGDITNLATVKKACANVSCVFHVAAYGMSGKESLRKQLIYAVNVTGTQHLLDACLAQNVPRLVYVASYNTVFVGKAIVAGDETMPRPPLHAYHDDYSRTKAIAEAAVLQADNMQLANGTGRLHTASVRPNSIYGPGEQRTLPRVVRYAQQGLFSFVFGSPDSKVDWIHVDNLIAALELAADGLTSEKNHVAGAQAYFVSDAQPINTFEFLRPLVEGLGYRHPHIRLPFLLVLWCAYWIEVVHAHVRHVYDFEPMLTVHEVYKSAVNQTCSIAKASRDLGYVPVQHDFNEVVEWMRQQGYAKPAKQHQMYSQQLMSEWGWLWVLCMGVLVGLATMSSTRFLL